MIKKNPANVAMVQYFYQAMTIIVMVRCKTILSILRSILSAGATLVFNFLRTINREIRLSLRM